MLDYTKVESRLKSFLKNNKRLGYSVALLVTFLINGGFTYADEAIGSIVPQRSEIQNRIEQEQSNVSKMLEDADKGISNIELQIKKLTQRGEFWVKPLDKSYQFFFIADWRNHSKNKDKSEKNFSNPEYLVSNGAGEGLNFGQYRNGRYYGMYGVIKNPLEFVDKIQFGANITPKSVPEKTINEKTVATRNIILPNVIVPTINVGSITMTPPATLALSLPPNPGNPNINVTPPNAITPLGSINVAAVPAINVNPVVPTVGEAPTINAITVQAPSTPEGFTPKMITPPEAPTPPTVELPTLPVLNVDVQSNGNGNYNVIMGSGSNGRMMAVSVADGDFKIVRNGSGFGTWSYTYNNYSGSNSFPVGGSASTSNGDPGIPVVPANGTWTGLSGSGTGGGIAGFQSVLGGANGDAAFLNNGNFIYTRPMESASASLGEFVHQDVHGADLITQQRTRIQHAIGAVAGSTLVAKGPDILSAYDDAMSIGPASANTAHTYINSGKLVIEGGNTSLGNTYTHTGGANIKQATINTGEIIFQPYQDGTGEYKKYSAVYVISNDGNNTQNIGYNGTTGKIKNYTLNAVGFVVDPYSTTNVNYINRGELDFYGESSSAMYVKRTSNINLQTTSDKTFTFNAATNAPSVGSFKPIRMYGDASIGYYNVPTSASTTGGNFAVDIGEAGKGNLKFDTATASGKTVGNMITGLDINPSGKNDSIEGSFGIFSKYDMALTSHQIRIYDKAEKSVGVYASDNAFLNLGGGTIEINGDTGATRASKNNTGIFLDGKGAVKSTGYVTVGGGLENTAIYAKGGTLPTGATEHVNVQAVEATNTQDSVLVYGSNGAKIKIADSGSATLKHGLTMTGATVDSKVSTTNKKDTGAVYATGSGTEITLDRTALPTAANISITGAKLTDDQKFVGFAFMAADGAVVNAKNNKIELTNGSTTAAAIGTGSKVNLQGSDIMYDGDGYAVYSDGDGEIDLRNNAKLTLRGKSTAFDLDLGSSTPPIKLDSTTRIEVDSDDVVVFNLKNASGLHSTNLATSITTAISSKLSGISLGSLVTGINAHNNYKIAAADGGTISIGNLDRSGTATSTTQEGKDGYYYFNRFLGQRMVATTDKGSLIEATLTSADAASRYSGQVVGFEMNSSKNATSNTEAAINLVSSKIIADRTDAGNGAIGAFINYGEVNVDSASKIEVEKGSNTVNDKAVGVYSVNGSKVTNDGEIEVAGNKSIGILGMPYREVYNSKTSKYEPVVDEFGASALGQGKVEIINNKNITMEGKDAIGIYSINNNTSSTVTDHEIKNTGKITVGDSDTATAVGIYADKVTVKPESGEIVIGKKAVGIYGTNGAVIGEANKDLGTVTYTAEDGVGIYLKGDSTSSPVIDDAILKGTKVTLDETSGATGKNKIGILANLGNDVTLTTEVDPVTKNLKNVVAYYTEANNLTVNSDFGIGEESVGISGATGKKLTYGDGTNTYVMNVAKKSTGVLGDDVINLKDKTEIKVNDQKAIGAYAKGANGVINADGKLTFTKEESVGLYVENGAKIVEGSTSVLDFSATTAKKNIGMYLAGSNWEGNNASTFTSEHEKANVYIYAQGAHNSGTNVGSTLTPKALFKVSPNGTASATDRTIGIYLNTEVKDKASTYVANTFDMSNTAAKLEVDKKGIGLYAKNASTTVDNIIKRIDVTSTDEGSVGVYTDGNLLLDAPQGKISAVNKGIGLYGNSGKVTVTGTHDIETTTSGTGVYLTNGTYLTGGKVTVKNNTSGTAAAGVYYTKGTASSQVTHDTDIDVTTGDNALALYADDGIDLKNAKTITIDGGQDNVGVFVTKASKFTNDNTINVGSSSSTITNGLGVYVEDGEATNNAGKNINVYDKTASTSSVGMAAVAALGKTAKVTNDGTITASGDAIAMNVADNSEGVNNGTIETNDVVLSPSNILKAIGAYINGNNAKFTNTGTVKSENIALALQDTKAGNVTAGTLELTKDGGVGVYAKDSEVDFDINPTVGTTTGTVGLYATGNTAISGNISSGANGNGHVGVYVADTNVNFTNTSKVTANNGSSANYGIGIYTAPGYTGTINTTIDQNGDKTIGLFAGNSTSPATGSDITFNGTINVGDGIGVYVPTSSRFVADNTTFNINGGTAVYLKGGDVELGKAGPTTINFGANGGTAIYQNGGTFSTGSNLTINGRGSFLAIKNADSTVDSTISVGKDGVGINAIYDATDGAKDYTLTLGTNGKFELNGDNAAGMAATVTGLGTANKATIINKGVIETIGSNVDTTGIIAKGAYVQNDGKINIGKNGVAIYTTNDGADTDTGLENNGEINLIEDEAKGIVANKANTTKDFVLGKISGTKEKLVGAFFKDSQAPVNVKDVNIDVGANSKGLVFEGGSNFTVGATGVNNQIKVGDTTDSNNRSIGIAAIGTSGTVSHTDVIAGSKQSMGLYAKNGTLTFDTLTGDLKSTDGNSILTYADGAAATISLNGGKTLEIAKDGIGLGVKDGGTITADKDTVVEVKGENGIGAYVNNGGNVDSKFKIKVKNAKGRGVYLTGTVSSYPEVDELKGDESVGYIFENVTNHVNMTNTVQITDTTAKKQVGVLAQGTGNGMTLNGGISVVGDNNTGVYSSTGQTVTNNGLLTVGASTGDSSIGIYSRGGAVINNGVSTIGDNSVGVYGEETSITTKDMTVGDKGVGLYLNNTALGQGDAIVNGNMTVGGNGAIGVQASNAKTVIQADLSVGATDSKGVFSENDGDVEVYENITVGTDSLGIYKNGNAEVKTAAGKTITVADKGYGIFAKGGAKVTNNSDVSVGKDAIGVYVDGNDLVSAGNVTVADKGVGLLIKNAGTLTSTGLLTVGSNNAVGLYADNANIVQNGNITVANNDGIGIYSKETGNVTTAGNITVGVDSIGVYKAGTGTMNIGTSSSQTMTIGDKGYGIYYIGNSSSGHSGSSRANNVINSNMTMSLGKEAVGIYGKNATINHVGDITVGETTIASNGYNDSTLNKNSIGIFGDNSDVSYSGHMTVDKPLSVGLYAANGGSITLKSGSVLDVKNGATGIMTGKGVETITIESGATLNASGKASDVDSNAGSKNVSFGISAYSGNIYNYGVINATNGATAIYKDGVANLMNRGTINIDASSTDLGATPTKANANLGGVNVDITGRTTIGGKLINGGTVNIKGDLSMAGMGLDISTGKTIVDARTITGVAYIEPNFSKGNSEQKVTVKDVFRTAPGGIGSFSGDVKSRSVSWIAKITKDPNDTTTTTRDITMVKLPYTSLIAGEKYANLANGLEAAREKVSSNNESAIFKSMDKIDNHKDFAEAVANLRGDIYSNIQERMKTVEGAFDKSYKELLDSYNVTKNVEKFSVIYSGGKHKDDTIGVTGYDYKTVGVLYLNDKEAYTYGGKYGWSAGVVGTNFKFTGETNKGSKERVVSGKLGLHYQAPLSKEDDNARLKWLTRGELTVNHHRAKRYAQVGNDSYRYKANYYSADLSWKNKIFYDYDLNTQWIARPYAGIDMSYGHIFGIREKGDDLNLQVKGKDYFVITPNIGVETKYTLPIGTKQLFVKADGELGYDLTKLYRNANQARIREGGSGYYDLSEPEVRRFKHTVGAELGVEKENNYGVTFRAEYRGQNEGMNYGVRLNYKF